MAVRAKNTSIKIKGYPIEIQLTESSCYQLLTQTLLFFLAGIVKLAQHATDRCYTGQAIDADDFLHDRIFTIAIDFAQFTMAQNNMNKQ